MIFFLALSILLEVTVTTLPLTLIILLFSAIVGRRNEVFVYSFFAGLLLDILNLRMLGLSSIYFVTIVLITLLYERKFETDTPIFILALTFLASFFYAILTGSTNSILSSILISLFAGIAFIVFRRTNKKVQSYG